VHVGVIRDHSDGRGGSFLPDKPFTPGETVTVSTNQKVREARGGRFSFTVARPAGSIPNAPLAPAERTSGDVQRFRSEAGLAPAAVSVTTTRQASSGDEIFLAPQQGPQTSFPFESRIIGPFCTGSRATTANRRSPGGRDISVRAWEAART
jgi:hypothetical protein